MVSTVPGVIATPYKAMTTDIQISMDDVVSAFVSQYEGNLYTRKKELSSDIREQEAALTAISDSVLAKVTGDSYDAVLPLGLVLEVSKGTLDWDDATVNFKLTIMSGEKGRSYYNNSIEMKREKPISASQVKAREKVQKELTKLRNELGEVLVSLKSVARKERQVRGRIAIRKLEDSGYANLMQDKELIKLVELD
jgi:hypothetical protein